MHRGKPLSWKLNGKTYELLYPQTNVALDTPAESPFASIIVTCRVEEAGGPTKSPKEKSKSDADSGDSKAVQPPDESLDDSKHDGGSDLLRNIRTSAEPILAEMAQKHGYGLADGKVIRRVAPPFPELRMTYYRVGSPSQWEAIPDGPSAMAFRWIDGRLQNWGMTFGSDHDGYSLINVIGVTTGIKAQGIDGPKELLAKRLPGDWVIRPGQPDQVVVQQLEKILQNELSIPVRLEFRKVDREVYVARGDYKLTPLPGHPAEEKMFYTDSSETTDPVEIFGEQVVPDSGSGGGTGDFAEFLQWLGEWTEVRIVDEAGKHPSRNISWKLHGRSPATEKMRRGDHDAELVLRNISKQTNLQFAKEAAAREGLVRGTNKVRKRRNQSLSRPALFVLLAADALRLLRLRRARPTWPDRSTWPRWSPRPFADTWSRGCRRARRASFWRGRHFRRPLRRGRRRFASGRARGLGCPAANS